MSITIYTSKGKEYTPNGTGTGQNQRISDYFFANLRLAVDTVNKEVISFFRARESSSGRSEQFYAVYSPRSGSLGSLGQFADELERAANDVGLSVDNVSTGTSVYQALSSASAASMNDEARAATQMVGGGKTLRFGVTDERSAVSWLLAFLRDGSASRVAVADQSESGVLSDYDVVLEPGSGRDLEPLGDTEHAIRQGQQQLKNQLVTESVQTIRDEVQSLRRNTSLSESDIREKVHEEVPSLKSPQRSTPSGSTSSTTTAATSGSSPSYGSSGGGLGGSSGGLADELPVRPKKALIIGALALVGIVAIVLIASSLLGVNPLALVLGGGGGGGVEIAQATTGGNALLVSGTVSGADEATIYVNDSSGESIKNVSAQLDESGEFSREFTDLGGESGTVTVNVRAGGQSATQNVTLSQPIPTASPTPQPTASPTTQPTASPTPQPTTSQTAQPTNTTTTATASS